MKSKKPKWGLRSLFYGQDRGFALIAAVTLMVLLALISVALMTLASSVSRGAAKGKMAEEARAQARLALQIAIGRMQVDLGPDQRITAMSGILSSESDETSSQGVSNPYILGVWNSWDSWLNRANSKGTKISQTYETGRSNQFRRWLISGADEELLKKWNSVGSGGKIGKSSNRDRGRVLMLGKGTLGDQVMEKEVYAGLVEMDPVPYEAATVSLKSNSSNKLAKNVAQTSRNKNYVAWWVSGENLKARVNLPKNQGSGSEEIMDVMAATWDTPVPDSSVIPGLENLSSSLPSSGGEEYDRKVQGMFTRGTLSLTQNEERKAQAKYFHDASFDSSGLLTDVRFGGLKKDISMLLSRDKLDDTEFFENGESDVGLRPYSSEDATGSVNNETRPLSSWKQLFYWNSLWDKDPLSGQDDTAPLRWSGSMPTTAIAADPGDDRVMNNRYTYLRQPILLKMYIFAGFSISARTVNSKYLPSGLCGANRPVFVWWNPYNITMEAGGNSPKMAGFGFAYRVQPLQSRLLKDGNPQWSQYVGEYNEGAIAPYGYGSYMDSMRGMFDPAYGFYNNNTEKKLTLAPGEIKVFTHDLMGKSTSDRKNRILRRTAGGDAKFDYMEFVPGVASGDITSDALGGIGGIPVPMLVRYGAASPNSQLDLCTPNFFIRFSMGYQLPAGEKALIDGEGAGDARYGRVFSDQSVYSMFLKPGGGSDSLNFAIGAGLASDRADALGLDDLKQGKAISKYFPSFFNINWMDEKPFSLTQQGNLLFTSELFNLMWTGYRGTDCDPGGNVQLGMGASTLAEAGTANPTANPLWISYYGISAKGAYPPADANSRYPSPFKDASKSDIRAKTWQHSSPLFWGGQMVNPSDLLRKNHPYQYEARQRTPQDYTQVVLEDVIGHIPEDKEGGAYFGHTSEDQVSNIVAAELPLHPAFSIAGFAGVRMTPGWFSDNALAFNGSIEGRRAKRFAYQSGVPGVGIGNSFADPMVPADSVYYNESTQDKDLADYWDHGFLINDALWDTWFASSISKRPSSFGGSAVGMDDVLGRFLETSFSSSPDASKLLPNKRVRLNPGTADEKAIRSELKSGADKNWEKSAKYLVVDGAFNVNSTSEAAWEAVLNGLKARKLLYMERTSHTPKILTESGKDAVYFSRFGIASDNQSRYDQPLLKLALPNDRAAWPDLRVLTASSAPNSNSDISKLAKEIVRQVKLRGPFLNMGEFVNRRLASGDLGLSGALQSAIDNAGLNDNFKSNLTLDAYSAYPNPTASSGSLQTASPGYLIQSDILSVLGNSLTVRDDTFTVRAYGQVCDPSGTKIEGRAWCEAVVQRTVDYVDPRDTPETPAIVYDRKTGALSDSQLNETNRAFGRKFKIVSFRWLNPGEV